MLSKSGLLKALWSHISTSRRSELLYLLAITVIVAISEVISIGAVLPFIGALMAPEHIFSNRFAQPLISALGLSNPMELLLPLTFAFVFATLFSGGMRLFLLRLQTRLVFEIGADFSAQIYRNTLYQNYASHMLRNSSEVITGISTKSNTVIYGILLPTLLLVSSCLILFAILVALVLIDPAVAIVSIGGFGFLYLSIMLLFRKRLANASHRIGYESNRVIKSLQEGLCGIRDVLIDGTQEIYCKIYRESDNTLRRAQADIQIISGSPRYIIESLGMTLIASLAFVLTQSALGIASAVGVLGALAISAQRLLPILQQIYSSWASIRAGRNSLEDVLELLDQPLPAYAGESQLIPIPFERSITLNQVGFRYSYDGSWILRGVDLEILRGQRIGFIGTTGSGKSTTLDIIMGLLQPIEGTISIDGVLLSESNSRNWQTHIAHVPQSIFLADSTIAENIALGIPSEDIDFERVRNAARQAQIAIDIESWRYQYDTCVGERGVRLSGGQRQRIGIARALYKQADVIVFDEATSALDGLTESAVMEALDSIGEGVTVLIVAHRITTLSACDVIFELEDGRVKRAGTYLEIISVQ